MGINLVGCNVPGYSLGFRLALKARFVSVFFGFLSLVAIAAFLAAQFSGRQPASVGLDVGLSVIRFVLPFVIVFITQEILSKEFERRYFLSSLSYPHSRGQFFGQRFAAIVTLCGLLLAASALALAVSVWFISKGYEQGTPVSLGLPYWLTILFIALDLLVLTSLAALLAVTASTSAFVLIGTLGFMLVARSFSAIFELLARDQYVVGDSHSYRAGIGLLSYLLPDLGALDVRMIALYGRMEFLPMSWPWSIVSSMAYSFGLFALAMWAVNRKRFI